MPDEKFEPPPAGEPIPQSPPSGSTDGDLGGVDVTDEYTDDLTALAASLGDELRVYAAAGATWAAVLAYARSFLGPYPPDRQGENVNRFTVAYYGNRTKAAWCLIFVWYVLKHFGLATWKLAYVPWLYKIKGEKNGHAGIKPGAICAISRFSHVGFYVADHGSQFDLLSGNSTSGGSSDAITVKRYSTSVISGYVNVAYAPADPNAYPGTVFKLKSPLMHDPHVKWIQTRLGAHGHKVTVDSYYGSKTAAAVKAFQRDAHLTQDGQCGPKTWKALAA